MGDYESIREFKAKFISLTSKANIRYGDYFREFRTKFIIRLRILLVKRIDEFNNSFKKLAYIIITTDIKYRHIKV